MGMGAGKNRKMFHEKYLLQSLNTGFKNLSPKNKGSYTEEKEKGRKDRKKDGREERRGRAKAKDIHPFLTEYNWSALVTG